jgi:hypothetical protein
MVTIANGEWIADLGNKTCWNIRTKMVVEFQKSGKAYVGKIENMPIELMSKWAAEPHGERRIQKAVEEAEDVFLRALFENKIEDRKNRKIV